jgi:hypothetical protein
MVIQEAEEIEGKERKKEAKNLKGSTEKERIGETALIQLEEVIEREKEEKKSQKRGGGRTRSLHFANYHERKVNVWDVNLHFHFSMKQGKNHRNSFPFLSFKDFR